MDQKTIELYCKYIIKPLEEQKNQLEKELLSTKFLRRFMKKRELSIDILRPVGYTGLACAGLSCRHCDDAGDCGASR